MSDPLREAYRPNWTRFLREVAEAVQQPHEDAKRLRDEAWDARRWPMPLPDHRKDQQQVLAALAPQVKAYAEQKTVSGRRALAEPLLAWTRYCAELLGVPLAEPAPPRMPYKED